MHFSFFACWNHEAGTVIFKMVRAVLLAALLVGAVAAAAAAGAPPWAGCALDGCQ